MNDTAVTAESTTDPIVLRAAAWDDVDHLLQLAALADPEIAGTSGGYPVPGQGSKRLALSAEQSGHVVAMSGAMPLRLADLDAPADMVKLVQSHIVEFTELAVGADAQRRGIGTTLLEATEKWAWAAEKGFRLAIVYVAPDDQAAPAFFRVRAFLLLPLWTTVTLILGAGEPLPMAAIPGTLGSRSGRPYLIGIKPLHNDVRFARLATPIMVTPPRRCCSRNSSGDCRLCSGPQSTTGVPTAAPPVLSRCPRSPPAVRGNETGHGGCEQGPSQRHQFVRRDEVEERLHSAANRLRVADDPRGDLTPTVRGESRARALIPEREDWNDPQGQPGHVGGRPADVRHPPWTPIRPSRQPDRDNASRSARRKHIEDGLDTNE